MPYICILLYLVNQIPWFNNVKKRKKDKKKKKRKKFIYLTVKYIFIWANDGIEYVHGELTIHCLDLLKKVFVIVPKK